jgi:hypothetical protein
VRHSEGKPRKNVSIELLGGPGVGSRDASFKIKNQSMELYGISESDQDYNGLTLDVPESLMASENRNSKLEHHP